MRYHKRSLILLAIIGVTITLMGCSNMSMKQLKNKTSKEVSKATSSFKKGLTQKKKRSSNSNYIGSGDGIPTIGSVDGGTNMRLVSRYNAIGLIDYCEAKGDKPKYANKVRSKLVKLVHKNNNLPIKKSQFYQTGRNGKYIITMGAEVSKQYGTQYNLEKVKMHNPDKSGPFKGESFLKTHCKYVAIAANSFLITGSTDSEQGKVFEIKEK